METAMELGRRAAMLKLAVDDITLGARPVTAPGVPKAPAPVGAAALRPTTTAPAPAPAAGPAAGGGMLAGLGRTLQGYIRDPANVARLIGSSGNLGRGILGTVGAPGLFAISNLARGGGELGSILRGGIPTGNQAPRA